MADKIIKCSLLIPQDLHKTISRMAEAEYRSFTKQIEVLCREALAARGSRKASQKTAA